MCNRRENDRAEPDLSVLVLMYMRYSGNFPLKTLVCLCLRLVCDLVQTFSR